VQPGVPPGRPLRIALLPAVAVIAFAVLTSIAVSEPWRSQQKGNDAIALASKGDFEAARAAATSAVNLDPLSADPYFDRAAVEDSAGNKLGAKKALERAVQVDPAQAEAWRRLGEYYLNDLSQPEAAIPVLRGAIYLDPFSQQGRNDYVVALRAQEVAAMTVQRRRARANSKRRKSGKRPAAASSTSP
jgi:tetratricopeptide (TPR) repeat protein